MSVNFWTQNSWAPVFTPISGADSQMLAGFMDVEPSKKKARHFYDLDGFDVNHPPSWTHFQANYLPAPPNWRANFFRKMYGNAQPDWPHSMYILYSLIELDEDPQEIYSHWNDLKSISLRDLAQITQSELTLWDLKAKKAIEELCKVLAA